MAQAEVVDTTNRVITVSDLILSQGEPRVKDLRLAEALGFAQVHMIRPLIKRHLPALAKFGEVSFTRKKPGSPVSDADRKAHAKGGRPGTTYFLNRKQALYITAKSETEKAAEVTIGMVEVFEAFQAGRLAKPVAVEAHRRARPQPRLPRTESPPAFAPRLDQDGFAVMRIAGEILLVDLTRLDARPGARAVVIGWDESVAVQDMSQARRNAKFLGDRNFVIPDPAARVGTRSLWSVGTVIASQPATTADRSVTARSTGKRRAAKCGALPVGPVRSRADLASIEVCGSA